MKMIQKIGRYAAFALAFICLGGVAQAQVVRSAIVPVTYTYVEGEFISLTPSTGAVTIPYTQGAGTAVAPALTLTTAYALGGSHANVWINVGFASSSVAFQGVNGGTVATGNVSTSWNGGAFSQCNGPSGPNPSGPANAACAQLNISSILNGTSGGAGSRTDSFVLEITNATSMVPDTYSGVINFQVSTN